MRTKGLHGSGIGRRQVSRNGMSVGLGRLVREEVTPI
jgi:hypothetical protein